MPPSPYNAAGEIAIYLIHEDETIKAQEDGVFLPYWYWEKIFDYIVDSQAALDIAAGNKTPAEK